jgi:hypothetical protein
MFRLRGRQVAGVGPLMDPSQPPVWSTYIATDDADADVEPAAHPHQDGAARSGMAIFAVQDTDATAAKATELGGQVMAPAFDIDQVGRFALLADPQGVAFGVVTAPPPGM